MLETAPCCIMVVPYRKFLKYDGKFVCLQFWSLTFVKIGWLTWNFCMLLSYIGVHWISKSAIVLHIHKLFFSDIHKKIKYIIIYYFLILSRLAMKFWYVFKVGNVTSYAKNNCIMHTFHQKFESIIIFFFHKIFSSIITLGYLSKIHSATLHIKKINYFVIYRFLQS